MLFKVCAPHLCSLKTPKTEKSTDCNLCAPSVLVPLSPTLSKDQLRLTLGGGPYLESLVSY